MRVAYADPPYPGQSEKHYADHPDYDGEVDHAALVARLEEFDGWALSTSSSALREVLALCPPEVRVMAWVKPWAAFKRNVSVAYAWEPVLVVPARRAEPNRIPNLIMRDWISEGMTMRRGLTGAKPERFAWWLFEVLGLDPADEFADLYPGSGAVADAHASWIRYLEHRSPNLLDHADPEPLWAD